MFKMVYYIHQLGKLSEAAGVMPDMSEQQKKLLAQLNPLNIEARYPSYRDAVLASLTPDVCIQLLRETEEMLLWIKAQR